MPAELGLNLDDLMVGHEKLFEEEIIRERVAELARQIAQDYREQFPEKVTPTGLIVLKGAMVFGVDLARALASHGMQIRLEVTKIQSYGSDNTSSRQPEMVFAPPEHHITGQHVLVIEDIYDTGHTLTYLIEYLLSLNPKSLKICVLLEKKDRHEKEVEVDYVGFQIPDVYAVGYGLDDDGLQRGLPHLAKKK